MHASNAVHLGEHLGEAFKHVGAIESTVKVHIQLRREVRHMAQLQGKQYFSTGHLIRAQFHGPKYTMSYMMLSH